MGIIIILILQMEKKDPENWNNSPHFFLNFIDCRVSGGGRKLSFAWYVTLESILEWQLLGSCLIL